MIEDATRDAIVAAAIAGTSLKAIARRHECALSEVHLALDEHAAAMLSPQSRARHLATEVEHLDAMKRVFLQHAIANCDAAAGTLCVKISERKAALLGLNAPVRLDLTQVVEHHETSTEYYERILAELKGPPPAEPEPPAH